MVGQYIMRQPNWCSIPCWNIMLHQGCFSWQIFQYTFVFLFQLLQVHVMRGWHAVCEFLSTTFRGFFLRVLYQENCWGWRGLLFHAVYMESSVPLPRRPQINLVCNLCYLVSNNKVALPLVLKFTLPYGPKD